MKMSDAARAREGKDGGAKCKRGAQPEVLRPGARWTAYVCAEL